MRSNFKPPKKVRIGGYTYTVEVDTEMVERSGVPGRINFWNKTIYLDPDCDLVKTFLHELVHGIDHDRQLELSEENTERMASGLAALMRDNRATFQRLLDTLCGE